MEEQCFYRWCPVGVPAFQIHLNRKVNKQAEETDNELPKDNLILRNKIELSPDQAANLFTFLTAEEESLEQIAAHEDRQAREALGRLYWLIAAYGRKIREGKQDGKGVRAPKKKIIPIASAKGTYFTVPQAAQICSATPRQIRAWIRRGKLEAVDLPGLGMIIESSKLNQFLCRKNS